MSAPFMVSEELQALVRQGSAHHPKYYQINPEYYQIATWNSLFMGVQGY